MHTLVINWKNVDTYHQYWIEHHRLRKEIFVDRLGWDLPNADDMEFDEFDTPAAQYVLCIDDQDRVCGVSRLVSTAKPFMIEKLWPEWFNGDLPKSNRVWEASRFGVSSSLKASERTRVIDHITQRIYRFGQENGIDGFLLVMPTFIYDRILIPRGYDLQLVSDVRRLEGIKTAIASVSVDSDMLPVDINPACVPVSDGPVIGIAPS